ncbi:hypothetical protein ABIB48_002607 [Arthrobacter sp. UYCu511]|uniref:hypothetical protein n=1 Tax=Arthrobacter sp. UYCu511 TaxID=3156337 RepID=UPI003390C002
MTDVKLPRSTILKDEVVTDVSQFRSATSGFHSEREFVDFIETNLEKFMLEEAGLVYKEHRREWRLAKFSPYGGNRARIDLMVESTSGRRIGIECKFPTIGTFNDMSRALSQILAYSVIARENEAPFDELYLLTTAYDDVVHKVIESFHLPINVIVFSRNERAKLVMNGGGDE